MTISADLALTSIDAGMRQPEIPIQADIDILQSAIAGRFAISTTGGTTTLDGTPDDPDAQNLFLDVSGVLASNGTVEIPVAVGSGRNRIYVVRNGTTGAFTLTVKKVGGTGVTVGQGNTAFLLYNGTDIQYVSPQIVSASGVIATSGTAFPSAPATNQRFFRTDRGIEYFYDGTRWLSTQLFNQGIPGTDGPVLPYAASIASAERLGAPWQGVYDLWLVEFQFVFHVAGGGTALSASHKWVTVLSKQVAAGTQTAIATVNIDSGASSVFRTSTVAIGALLGTTHFAFEISHTKTGTPGSLYSLPHLVYRLVG